MSGVEPVNFGRKTQHGALKHGEQIDHPVEEVNEVGVGMGITGKGPGEDRIQLDRLMKRLADLFFEPHARSVAEDRADS